MGKLKHNTSVGDLSFSELFHRYVCKSAQSKILGGLTSLSTKLVQAQADAQTKLGKEKELYGVEPMGLAPTPAPEPAASPASARLLLSLDDDNTGWSPNMDLEGHREDHA